MTEQQERRIQWLIDLMISFAIVFALEGIAAAIEHVALNIASYS